MTRSGDQTGSSRPTMADFAPGLASEIAVPPGDPDPLIARAPYCDPSGRSVAPTTSAGPSVLTQDQWRAMESDHHQLVDTLTAGHRERRATGQSHPVEDFLFTYYALRPAQLRRWHPGAGNALLDATERASWRFYAERTVPDGLGSTRGVVGVGLSAYLAARGESVDYARGLLRATAGAPAQFGCFGLHEWAMVFSDSQLRHDWPLRLGRDGTDDVVRSHQIKCSHYDAFRFFTPAARPLNLLAPDLSSRARMEQPGCLHASMDLYKWAYKLLPLVSSSLVLECFVLAREIRQIDMRASPYDLSDLGYTAIKIETTEGKAQYVAAQRNFADRGQKLRAELLNALDQVPGIDERSIHEAAVRA